MNKPVETITEEIKPDAKVLFLPWIAMIKPEHTIALQLQNLINTYGQETVMSIIKNQMGVLEKDKKAS